MHYKQGAATNNLLKFHLEGESLGGVRHYQVPRTGSEPCFDGTDVVFIHLSPVPSNHHHQREPRQTYTFHKSCLGTPLGVS